ncbi:MAG: aminotransferase class IV [Phycisphaerae bacterium]
MFNSSDFVVLDGQILAAEDVRLSPFDAGLLHGAGLFETLRARNKVPLNLADHLARLTESGKCFGMDIDLDAAITADLIAELLDANDLHDARVRITVTRGDTRIDADTAAAAPTVLLCASAFQPYPAVLYEKGMTVVLSRFAQNPRGPLTGHKSTSYLDRLLALREARAVQAGEALWFTHPDKYLAEGCVSNVFLIMADQQIATPPWLFPAGSSLPSNNLVADLPPRLALPGITRQHIMRLCAKYCLPVTEKMLTIHDVLAAREIILTNAIMGVMPITHVERHGVGDETPGPVTQRLSQWYNEFIEEQSHGSIA